MCGLVAGIFTQLAFMGSNLWDVKKSLKNIEEKLK
jgi:predicted amino acid-binding ACT domain protein